MKRYFFLSLFLIALSALPGKADAQAQKQKIAIFTPLFLDSAFDAQGNFRFEKTGAKFLTPGLDFYYGAQMALDSLQKRGAPLEVFVYDTRGDESIGQQLSKPEMKDVELIIGQSNAAETKTLAEAALRKKIPFISATLPNDAGIYNNPYFVVLNTTLQSHVEGIYRYLQKYHSLDRIIVFRKPGAQEDQLKNHFNDFTKSTLSTPLSIKFVELGGEPSAQAVAAQLDSNRKTVCIAGSLDEGFGIKLAQILAGLGKKYPVMALGMPTWDNFNLNRPELSNLEIVYSTPFFYNRMTPLETQLATDFSNKMSVRPSDMFFRGYETTLRFALLLLDTKKDVASSLSRKGNTVLTQFDIQPVFKDKSAMSLDYFENKHLYFVKVMGGTKNIVN
ncbi:MAG TPA: ABC transporter substrate-binding protein [Flavisolibacter sp.]|nr:ABC transporter substrate-binding protein [Flavisolibacter sp.]